MDNKILVRVKKTGELKRIYYRWAAQMISRGEASFVDVDEGAPPSNTEKKSKKKKKSVPKKSKKQD